ncbi:hypothetical protein D3C77_347570 [compost metagenome]
MQKTQVIICLITYVIEMPDHHRPATKAAMDRPQQSRGLATDPGVQRKAPRTVIRRTRVAVGDNNSKIAKDRRQQRVAADFTGWPWRQGQTGNQLIAEQVEMTTIIEDRFASGAQVSMEMDKDAGELFVFHCPAGQGCIVSKCRWIAITCRSRWLITNNAASWNAQPEQPAPRQP